MSSAPPQPPLKVAEFYVFPINLPPLPSLEISATHFLYLRPDAPLNPTPESARSLFLANVPIDSTEKHFKHLFSTQIGLPAGRVREVRFEQSTEGKKPTTSALSAAIDAGKDKKSKKRKHGAQPENLVDPSEYKLPSTWDRELHRSGSTAIVEFVDKASMHAALKAARAAAVNGSTVTWGKGIEDQLPPLGFERYLTHDKLTYPPKDELLSSVNAYMTAYNARQEAEVRERARKRQEPDEDGFVTVTRGGRNPAARMEEAKERLEKQREKQKGLGDFYRFQGRERRKEREAELLKKFEEDKEKVRRMKVRKGNFVPES